MKKQKVLNAFKAFEIENTKYVLGGKKTCTWVGKDKNGNTICDIFDSKTNTESCGVPDSGLSVGESWGNLVYAEPGMTTKFTQIRQGLF